MSTNGILKKEVIIVGDFTINLLDFEQNQKVQNVFHIMFGHNMVPIINRPTYVTNKPATVVDHILVNTVTTAKFARGTVKYSRSFSNIRFCRLQYSYKEAKEHYTFRRDPSNTSVQKFSDELLTVSWNSITQSSDTNNAYDNFIDVFISLYGKCFPKEPLN